MNDVLIIMLALGGSLAGVLLCWRNWRRGAQGWAALGWAVLPWAMATAIWCGRFGAEIGLPLALETAALVAFAFILSRAERRPDRSARPRQATLAPPRDYRRGVLRASSGGVLGFAAAMGIALLFATRAPLAEQTRLILAALAVPSLWCAAIAWTMCDRRIAVQALTFAGLATGCAGLTLVTA